jgi:hypothetical protein
VRAEEADDDVRAHDRAHVRAQVERLDLQASLG